MQSSQTVIRPPAGVSLGLKELWQYRELFYFFTWRDIKVKYKQTTLGVVWALLQPLGLMILFTLLFSKTIRIETGSLPYPIFVLSGLILWNLFYGSISQASESMLQQSGIIKKIYFPRLIIPCSAVLVSFFDFLMAFIVFICLCFYYLHSISWTSVLYFPAGILLVLLSAFGTGTFFAALNIKFRDFRYALPFLLQVLFFASQVIYPLQIVQSTTLKYFLAINPVNGAIELFRASLSGTVPDFTIVLLGIGSTLFLTFIGLFYFRKTEVYLADIA